MHVGLDVRGGNAKNGRTFREKYFYFYLRIRWGVKKVQKVPKKKYFFGKVLLLLPPYKMGVRGVLVTIGR